MQARWRGRQARQDAALLLLWWDAVVEEDAATRIQAAFRGRQQRAIRDNWLELGRGMGAFSAYTPPDSAGSIGSRPVSSAVSSSGVM